ncbi:MAG: HPr(Ser) kinase/phosphatase [Gammaproteobacteria bacterium]|nr:HPr(Ser) kinase/phosphatase [Gammaproteobacteria bacterium]
MTKQDNILTPIVTTKDLFESQKDRFKLEWLAGHAGGNALLEPATAKFPGLALAGHLNFIHPNRVQVIGENEINYFKSLTDSDRKEAISRLLTCEATVIIILTSGGRMDDLIEQANIVGKPVFQSPLPSPVIIEHLQYYLTRALAPRLTTHGVYLEVMGMGVMITGESGIGKSELALELLSRNHRLIADDAVEFIKVGPDVLVGQCPEALTDYLEVRGLGILDIRAMFGETAVRHKKKLHFIVHLERLTTETNRKIDRLKAEQMTRSLLDVQVPEVILYVAPGRNLAVLVETAVRSHILKMWGIDVLEQFTRRHQKLINKGSSD